MDDRVHEGGVHCVLVEVRGIEGMSIFLYIRVSTVSYIGREESCTEWRCVRRRSEVLGDGCNSDSEGGKTSDCYSSMAGVRYRNVISVEWREVEGLDRWFKGR